MEWLNDLNDAAKEGLPEALRDNPTFGKFKTVGDLAKSYAEIESMQGRSLRIPGDEATDEERSAFNDKVLERAPGLMARPDFDDEEQTRAFYAALGVPDAADKYVAPEDVKVDDAILADLRQTSHELKLTPSQFTMMATKLARELNAGAEAQQAASDAAEQALKKEWGLAYDQKVKQAERAASEFGADFNQNPKAWAKVAEALSGKKEVGGDFTQEPSVPTPAEIEDKIAAIQKSEEYSSPVRNIRLRAGERVAKLYGELEKSKNAWANQ